MSLSNNTERIELAGRRVLRVSVPLIGIAAALGGAAWRVVRPGLDAPIRCGKCKSVVTAAAQR
jgi:hypothetical protein